MVSAFDTRFAAAAVPALMEEHGEAVTRYPLGDTAAGASVTLLLNREKPERTGDTESVKTVHRINAQALSAQTLNLKDRWLIDGEVWRMAESPGKAEGGLKPFVLVLVDDHRTSRRRGGLI